jgi:phosphoglycolate phosphatase
LNLATPRFVFDLDGTLIDGFEDLLAAVNHALRRVGAGGIDLPTLRRHVGHGARDLMVNALASAGGDPKRQEEAFHVFQAAYRAHCTAATQPYPGVVDLLRSLGPARAAVLTNKPRGSCLTILRALGLRDHVGPVVGGDSLSVKKPHPATLRFVALLWNVPMESLVVVGDSVIDVELARRSGVPAIGVSWGCDAAEVLESAGAQRVIREPAQLVA